MPPRDALTPSATAKICLLLFTFALLLYAKTVTFDFIPSWDDEQYVITNPLIESPSSQNITRAFTTTVTDHYSPAQTLSYMVDYAIWQRDPRGYHLTNIILHALSAVSLFLLLLRLGIGWGVALMASLLFITHPLNVENVAWISERKSMLSTLFMFLTLLSYLTWKESQKSLWYLLSLGLGLLAVLSKSSAVILPLLVLLIEWYRADRPKRVFHSLPFFAFALFGTYMTMSSHLNGPAFSPGVLSLDYMWNIVYPTVVVTWWKYIWLLVYPSGLSGFYDTTIYQGWMHIPVVASLTGWIITTFLVLRYASRNTLFWYLWFWICFLPVSNVIPINTYYADRYMYTPAIGLFVIVAVGLERLCGTYARVRPYSNSLYMTALLTITLTYAVTTFNRMDVWRNEITFWQDTVEKSPRLYKPRLNLGVSLERAWRLEEAAHEFEVAARIDPDSPAARYLQDVRFKQRLIEQRRR